MAVPETPEEIRDVNRRYHDSAARDYDAKWGISYGEQGRQQVRTKLHKALGGEPGRFPRALEIGAGTGYFTLNLLQDGIVGEATCTDVSPAMLGTLERNAGRLGLAGRVSTAVCAAERLPFPDESFDLVLGHAVLHHVPDLGAAFAEFRRVLRPGGAMAFAGEPSASGDRIAAVPKRAAFHLSPAWRALMRARPAARDDGDAPPPDEAAAPAGADHADGRADGHHLEFQVDVHAFSPGDLARRAREAGFAEIRVRGEELLANWFGWVNRTLEASARPEDVPWLWQQYAYRGYLALQQVDRALLEPRLPPHLFYNLMVSGRRPGG
jgi:ubiquinone/menaquinone biosynthesis C-methylase UbiE